MTFSFIVIGRSYDECKPALSALETLQGESFETIISLGLNPSQQRNEGARRANGDYLIFLDNDSRVDRRLIHYYRDALLYSKDIKVVGGPVLYDGRNSFWKKAAQCVFSSAFGLGPFRARYASIGRIRETSERELILCNLLVERAFFLSEGGFHLDLYPNEENEFLNRVHAKGRLFYHPLAICRREPPANLFAYTSQMFRYGKGRAKHLVLNPRGWNLIFLTALAFTLYAFALMFLLALSPAATFISLPAIIYAAFATAAALLAALETRRWFLIAVLPPLFFLCHFVYGCGLFAGLLVYPFKNKSRAIGTVELRSISSNVTAIGER